MPIPSEITALTGITDTQVAGQRIDDTDAIAIVASTDLAIAHNASFDAPRIERRLPAIAGHAWACSCNEVPWPEQGFDVRKLGHLLMQMGLFHQGRRAAADVWATVNLLGRTMPEGETALFKLIQRAERPSIRIEATHAPFEAKEALKGRGYRWNSHKRVWATEQLAEAEEDERQWLREVCGCATPDITQISWRVRHRP